ncbi:MAG: heme exporter protein CcmD [Caulobacteraceae bacterium]
MIGGGWDYVWPAYAIALGALAVLAVTVLLRLRSWSRRARDLDRPK